MMFRTPAIALLLLLASHTASACVIFDEPPEVKLEKSQGMFLARTVSIEREPLPEGPDTWPRDHRQNVVWEVVKVWKGDAKVGERFDQTVVISVYQPCSGHQHVPEPMQVVFLSSNDSPPWRYIGMPNDYAIRMLNALTQGTVN